MPSWVDTELRMWDIPTAILGDNVTIPMKTGDLKQINVYRLYKKLMSIKCQYTVEVLSHLNNQSRQFQMNLYAALKTPVESCGDK